MRHSDLVVCVFMMVVSVSAASIARAQDQKAAAPTTADASQVLRLTPDELTWQAGPPMLPPGARMAVIEGTFNMGLGETLDTTKGKALPAGIIQEHGTGPRSVHYLHRP